MTAGRGDAWTAPNPPIADTVSFVDAGRSFTQAAAFQLADTIAACTSSARSALAPRQHTQRVVVVPLGGIDVAVGLFAARAVARPGDRLRAIVRCTQATWGVGTRGPMRTLLREHVRACAAQAARQTLLDGSYAFTHFRINARGSFGTDLALISHGVVDARGPRTQISSKPLIIMGI